MSLRLALWVVVSCSLVRPCSCFASLSTRAFANSSCIAEGRLLYCRHEKIKNDVLAKSSEPSARVIVEVTVNSKELAAKFADGSLAEYLTLLGPISRRDFDKNGFRVIDVSLPQLGLWAHWQLHERPLLTCGEGGVTWAMAVVLANYLGSAPEFPRLHILELGAGTGLVSLALAGRGHTVVSTDGDDCVLDNLRSNIRGAQVQQRISIERLRWEVDGDRAKVARRGPFDALVGADLIYDEARCSALIMTLNQLMSDTSEALFVERDRVQRATACAKSLESSGFLVEKLPPPVAAEEAVVDGVKDPTSLHPGGSPPLILRVTHSRADRR